MKQFSLRRTFCICSAAGLLALTGCSGQTKQNTLDVTWDNGTELHLTDACADIPHFGMGYANTQYNSRLRDYFCPAEPGWFYWQPKIDAETGYIDYASYVLYYADRETGQSVPLCAKPNCLHDGNAFCTASTKVYDPAPVVFQDGYLYALTTKKSDTDNKEKNTNTQVLLRYSADGTEITELSNFGAGYGNSPIISHRGYLWFTVQLQNVGEEIENPITHRPEIFTSGGWQLCGYEIATGKVVCICDAAGDPNVNHVNNAPRGSVAVGDYIYYEREHDDWSGSQGVWRISLLTGKEEKVTDSQAFWVGMSQHDALHSQKKGMGANRETVLCRLDLETLEKTEIDSGSGVYSSWYFSMDENYLYLDNIIPEDQTEILNDFISVYDHDGNFVKNIETEFFDYPGAESEPDENGYVKWYSADAYIAGVQGGMIYVEVRAYGNDSWLDDTVPREQLGLWCCPTDDLMNKETPEWTMVHPSIPGL